MDELCEWLSVSGDPAAALFETFRHWRRHGREAASSWPGMARWNLPARAGFRSGVVQERKNIAVWPVADLLRAQRQISPRLRTGRYLKNPRTPSITRSTSPSLRKAC